MIKKYSPGFFDIIEIFREIGKACICLYAEEIVSRVYGCHDEGLRFEIFSAGLGELEPEVALEILDYIYQRTRENKLEYKITLLNLLDTHKLASAMTRYKIGKIYLIAQKRKYNHIVDLITRSSSSGRNKFSSVEQLSDPEMEYIPLGTKMSLAKSPIKDVLDRLLYEGDPRIINNILNNPRITEREVLKIASRRPNSVEVLKCVFRNHRWISRHSVKKALIRNPYTPMNISLGLLNFMLVQDLVEISNDRYLHPDILKSARNILKDRREHRMVGWSMVDG